MNLKDNIFLDECVIDAPSTSNLERECQEEGDEKLDELEIYFINIFSRMNVSEEGNKEIPSQNMYQLRSKGHVLVLPLPNTINPYS